MRTASGHSTSAFADPKSRPQAAAAAEPFVAAASDEAAATQVRSETPAEPPKLHRTASLTADLAKLALGDDEESEQRAAKVSSVTYDPRPFPGASSSPPSLVSPDAGNPLALVISPTPFSRAHETAGGAGRREASSPPPEPLIVLRGDLGDTTTQMIVAPAPIPAPAPAPASVAASTPKPQSPAALALLSDESIERRTLPKSLPVEEMTQAGIKYLVVKDLRAAVSAKIELLNALGFYDFNPNGTGDFYKLQFIYNLANAINFPIDKDRIEEFEERVDRLMTITITDGNYFYIQDSPVNLGDLYDYVRAELTRTRDTYLERVTEKAHRDLLTNGHQELIKALEALENRAGEYLSLLNRLAKDQRTERIEAQARAKRLAALEEKKKAEAAEAAAGAGAATAAAHPAPARAASPRLFPNWGKDIKPKPAREEPEEIEIRDNRVKEFYARKTKEAEEAEAERKLTPEQRRAQKIALIADGIKIEIIPLEEATEGRRQFFTLVNPRMPDSYDFMNIFSCLGLHAPDPELLKRKVVQLITLQYLRNAIQDLNARYQVEFPIKFNDDLYLALGKACPIYIDEHGFSIPIERAAFQDFYALVRSELDKLYEKASEKASDKIKLAVMYNDLVENLAVFEKNALEYHALIATLAKPINMEREEKRVALAARMKM